MLLELDGHIVEEARDGLEGLMAVLRSRFDVALVDLGLPGMDGYEFVHRVRNSRFGRDTSLVALTGGTGRGPEREEALEAGFDAFLLKPVGAEVVDAILADPPRHASLPDGTRSPEAALEQASRLPQPEAQEERAKRIK
jgi:CheY-like chemotaxis protein